MSGSRAVPEVNSASRHHMMFMHMFVVDFPAMPAPSSALAELVYAYMFSYARGQSLRHVVVLASFFATSHRFLQVRIHV